MDNFAAPLPRRYGNTDILKSHLYEQYRNGGSTTTGPCAASLPELEKGLAKGQQ